MIPFFCNALETAQGSSSHASIPSVIRIIIFLAWPPTGKSSAALSRDLAIGVVPLGLIFFRAFVIAMFFPFPILTSS